MKGFIFKEQTKLMKYCKIFWIYAALLIVMCSIWVEVGIAQSDWMPDANLRTEVLAELKRDSIVDQTATTFTQENLADTKFTGLNASNLNVGDLTGLKYAIHLTYLAVTNGGFSATAKISDISELRNLTSLRNLNLAGNNISNISPLSGLITLETLILRANNISDISPLSGLINLETLYLYDNNISDISPLSGLTSLEELYLYDNNISDLSPLSGLTSLTRLELQRNRIRTTDGLLTLTSLQILYLYGNRITDIGEFQKLSSLSSLTRLHLLQASINDLSAVRNDNVDVLRNRLWTRPGSIDPNQAVTFGNQPENPPETFPFTIRFSEPVLDFQMDDIIIETDLDSGTGSATLEALTPVGRLAQTYTVTIRLPVNAAGRLRVIVRQGAAETDDGRIDPSEDRAFQWIPFTTIPATEPRKRRIIQDCPVGWVRSDGFAGRNRRVLIYEVNLQMDMSNLVSIYKPVWVAIYVHPDEALETLDGWKLQVALPYNHHREYLLTAENSLVVDAGFVEGGFAFIENPEEDPFPMVGVGFTGAPAPGFDYRLYDETGKRVDFGISCYKRGDIFPVLKEMEDPRVLRQVLLESFDWDSHYLRSEWTVPVPVNAPGAPSLHGVNLVGTWADLKKH